MRKLCIIAGLAMLAGCHKAPANNTTHIVVSVPDTGHTKVVDPTWTLADPCGPGVEEVYQAPDGSYMTWIGSDVGWVKLSSSLIPEEECKKASEGKDDS